LRRPTFGEPIAELATPPDAADVGRRRREVRLGVGADPVRIGPLGEVPDRVQRVAVAAPLEVQVGDVGAAGVADLRHDLAAHHQLPRRGVDGAAVAVEGGRAVGVEDDEEVPVAAHAVVGVDDQPVVGGPDVGAHLGHDVHAVVGAVTDLGAAHAAEAAAEEAARDGPEHVVARLRGDLGEPLRRRAADPEAVGGGAGAELEALGARGGYAPGDRDPTRAVADPGLGDHPVAAAAARVALVALGGSPGGGAHGLGADGGEVLGGGGAGDEEGEEGREG
jgi:hypothetical protein